MRQLKLVFLICVIMTISSCGLNSGWSENAKKEFLYDCYGNIQTTSRLNRCDCILNGVMSEYVSLKKYKKAKRAGNLHPILRQKLNTCDKYE
jgi:hypothetical protein